MHNSNGLALSQEGLLKQRADVALVIVNKIWDYIISRRIGSFSIMNAVGVLSYWEKPVTHPPCLPICYLPHHLARAVLIPRQSPWQPIRPACKCSEQNTNEPSGSSFKCLRLALPYFTYHPHFLCQLNRTVNFWGTFGTLHWISGVHIQLQ